MSDPISRLNVALADEYRVERPLGEGGMATVYLARDLRHNRNVALKVLKSELAAALGAERFLAEIETTARLQHPHILPLFDSGEIGGVLYYVMPYVAGETLRERIERERQLDIDQAVAIARDVADALAYAHRAGVVHRDVKPENILLQDSGAVVSDFGIALAVTHAEAARLTQTGLSIGTPTYMSPEQATGDAPLDARSDLYSLGCVVYEMLVGQPPHDGRSVQAIVAHVLTGEVVSPRAARPTVPPNVSGAVLKAIERLPADRFTGCEGFVEALADPSFRHGADPPSALAREARRWRAASVVAMLACAIVAGLWIRSSVVGGGTFLRTPIRFEIPFDGIDEYYAAGRNGLAVSEDGTQVAFVAGGARGDRLRLRSIDGVDSRLVPGSQAALDPFFSPDGSWVGYVTVDGIVRVPVEGGPPERVADFPEPQGVHWADDGWLYFGSYSGLWRVPEGGGQAEQLTALRPERGETLHSRPKLVDEGAHVVFTVGRGPDEFELAAYFMAEDRIEIIGPGLSPAVVDGTLIFGRMDGALVAAEWDPNAELGPTTALLEGLMVKPGHLEFAAATGGVLVYTSGASPVGRLVLVSADGAEEALLGEGISYNGARFSPDGRRVSVGIGAPPTRQVWIVDVDQRLPSPLTYEGHNYYGVWTPDGEELVFARETGESVDIFSRASDHSGSAQLLLADGAFNYPESWAPDGRTLLVRVQDEEGSHDIFALDAQTGAKRPLLTQPANEESPKISPDGRWLAYASDLDGDLDVYLTTFPEPGARHQVSIDGGTEPVWAPDGRRIYYWDADTLLAAEIDATARQPVGSRTEILVGPYVRWPFHANYDIHPDGDRFVMAVTEADARDRIVVVVNWLEELRGTLAVD